MQPATDQLNRFFFELKLLSPYLNGHFHIKITKKKLKYTKIYFESTEYIMKILRSFQRAFRMRRLW